MNPANPLDSVYFINIPENFSFSSKAMHIDTSIPLPVQKKDKDAPGVFNIQELTQEQILSGILTVLAYDKNNKNLNYYRSVLKDARPEIKRELAEAAILKTRNEDWDLAEEIWMALQGFDPEDVAITVNMALFFDQKADSYRRSGLDEDADAYDDSALNYYKQAMSAEPEVPDAFFNAAYFYLKKNDFVNTKSCLETYLALTVDVKDEELGENGTMMKEQAQELIQKINSRSLEDQQFKKAYDLICHGKEEEGLEEIRQFLLTHPMVWNAWFLLGWGLRRLERYEDAKQAFLKAQECEGGDDNADTLNEMAICQMETGDYDGAKDSLIAALNIDGENTKIISNLGYLYLKLGEKEEAKKYFNIVLEIDPEDKIARYQVDNL